MNPSEATELTRKNRHKQDDEFIIKTVLEGIFAKIGEAAFNGENTIEDFFPDGMEMRFRSLIIGKLKGMGYEILEGSYRDEYGSYQKSKDTVIRWKM